MAETYADTVHVCMACDRRSNDHYGYDPIDEGWTIECCYRHSVEVKKSHVKVDDNGNVEILGEGIVTIGVNDILNND